MWDRGAVKKKNFPQRGGRGGREGCPFSWPWRTETVILLPHRLGEAGAEAFEGGMHLGAGRGEVAAVVDDLVDELELGL